MVVVLSSRVGRISPYKRLGGNPAMALAPWRRGDSFGFFGYSTCQYGLS